jgi:hypothetical protein
MEAAVIDDRYRLFLESEMQEQLSMITGVDQKYVTSEMNRSTLSEYWNGYFLYERDAPELHVLTQSELRREVEECKAKPRPFVDAQFVVGKVLTRLGEKHNFHRQFSERFGDLQRAQILGMQLYTIMLADDETWIYHETQHEGHLFPHATYFLPSNRMDRRA